MAMMAAAVAQQIKAENSVKNIERKSAQLLKGMRSAQKIAQSPAKHTRVKPFHQIIGLQFLLHKWETFTPLDFGTPRNLLRE